MEDVFSKDLTSQPVRRSKEFYDALIALGGSPEEVAPHLGLPEAEVAGEMAQARGRIVIHHCGDLHSGGVVPGGPRPIRSNWFVRGR